MFKKLILAGLMVAALPAFAAVSLQLGANDWLHHPDQLYITLNTTAGELVSGVTFNISVDKPGPIASRYFMVASTNYSASVPFPTYGPWSLVSAPHPVGDAIVGASDANPAHMLVSSLGVSGPSDLGTLNITDSGEAFDTYLFTLTNFSYQLVDLQFQPGPNSNTVEVQVPEPSAALLCLLGLPLALIRRRRRRTV